MALEMNSSKEFQMILKSSYFKNNFDTGKAKVVEMLQTLKDESQLEFDYIANTGEQWSRTSDRYDTSDGWLASYSLSCAVEYSTIGDSSRSKLKLKYNVWNPHAAYDQDEIKNCIVYPDKDYEEHGKLKVEQDFNAKGTKFGLSGSIIIKGSKKVTVSALSELESYFKRIDRLNGYQSTKPLTMTSYYSETVFDNIELKIGPNNLPLEGSLGCRYEATGNPFKVEFSVKAEEPSGGWNYETQVYLSQLFHRMIQHELHVDHETISNRVFPPVAIQS